MYRWLLLIAISMACRTFVFAADEKAGEPSNAPSAKRVESLGDAAATVDRVIQGMKSAGERIARKETGADTRNVQQQVIEDLQSLIDAASQMQKQRQQGQRQEQRPQNGSEKQPQEQTPSDSGQGGQTRRQDNQGIDSTEATGDAAKKEAEAERRRKLLGAVWGHLPESLRQRLLNDLGEKTLPGYDDLVRRYFEALAEQSKPGSKTSEKKIK